MNERMRTLGGLANQTELFDDSDDFHVLDQGTDGDRFLEILASGFRRGEGEDMW